MTLPVVFTANGSQGYNLTNSLRFRSSASAYLSRTFGTPTNNTVWTYSCWIKRGNIGTQSGNSSGFFGNSDALSGMYFISSDVFRVMDNSGSVASVTTAVYRDPSAWAHLVVKSDGTYIKTYWNNVEVASYTGTITNINKSGQTYYIGRYSSTYLDGYLAEVNFIDGQALTPSSFGSTNAQTGVWQPAKYTGTYGTNGFYLPFTDNSALTTSSNAGLGKDFSGNGNYWTTNNISITSGATYDSMTDVPTLTDTDTANYCVVNPLQNGGLTITNANLTWAGAGSSAKCATGSIAMTTGKWYFEALITGSSGGNWGAGVCNLSPTLTSAPTSTATGWGLVTGGGGTVLYKVNNNSFTSLSSSSVTNSVVGFAVDVDAGKIWFSQNGTWLEGSPSAGTGASYTNLTNTQIPFIYGYDSNDQGSINFGQRPFAYTPPAGFVALNTFNLPTPTIGATASTQANKYMDISLYTGTGSSQSITGLNFQPDWTWIKSRSGATDHGLYDAVRGVQNQLESNTTTAETTETTGLTAFNSNGFTVGALAQLNTSSATYVGWNWKANGSGSSNTDGSITSTVSANTSAGFSICTLTAQASGTGTFGHGLGVAPSLVITKLRASANSWATWHTSIANTQYLLLNTTDAVATAASYWNSTSPTSTVVSLGTAWAGAGTMVAYCFAQIAGYSAFGSYTGNGSSDGPFVFTGFRPRFVLVKRTDSTSSWGLIDTARDTYNVTTKLLFPNASDAENTSYTPEDILSNGFKLRDTTYNISSGTYIYMAFAENPFKYSLAR